eukprot:Blabericola_migrator_1__3568@NODE_205_length_11429_cov_258_680338_g176_i0_p2_GENE_NODE_205_length_11429_cov_258_680338_g176_i0NODE_205_length_11429_cov_258_680338_g176_i0_p2_ORF_typecomplete_len610_score131_99DNA_pol_B/PF00136_21/3e37zfC4pol/PF14260_6/3_6e03zfC4pol/PF14260_6/8_6e08_NODE_205_length_11429_cov_258_680338_g176_i070608889
MSVSRVCHVSLLFSYGYTGASFSGRMPCGEVADAIVSLARWCLNTSIDRIHAMDFGRKVEVVYGDTDSMFIHVPNASMEEAIEVGQKAVDLITQVNIDPMDLKFEKVYETCCLQTKKRYTGQAFESVSKINSLQEIFTSRKTGGFLDSKGIETIRRDQCGLVQKSTGRFLQSLFSCPDLSELKDILIKTIQDTQYACLGGNVSPLLWHIIDYDGSVPYGLRMTQQRFFKYLHEISFKFVFYSLQDFIYSKDLKLGNYAWNRGGPVHTLPPQAVLALQTMEGLADAQEGEEGAFDQGEQISFLFSSMGRSDKMNDQVVAFQRIVTQSPRPVSTTLITDYDAPLQEIWQASIGQFTLTANIDYYIKRQIIQVLKRLCVLLPGTASGSPLPLDRWMLSLPRVNEPHSFYEPQDIPVFPLTSLYHTSRQGVQQGVTHLTPCQSIPHTMILDTEDQDDQRGFKAPVQALIGSRTLETFFHQDPLATEITNVCVTCKGRMDSDTSPNTENPYQPSYSKLLMSKYKTVPIAKPLKEVHLHMCGSCLQDKRHAVLQMMNEARLIERGCVMTWQACLLCTQGWEIEAVNCTNALHCPIYFHRNALTKSWQSLKTKIRT